MNNFYAIVQDPHIPSAEIQSMVLVTHVQGWSQLEQVERRWSEWRGAIQGGIAAHEEH